MERERRRDVYHEVDPERTRPVEPYNSYSRGEPRHEHEVEYVREYDSQDGLLARRELFRRATNVVWTIIGLIEILIGLRILLKLIAANAANGFVHFIYDFSGVFVSPFVGIVHDLKSGNAVLEVNSLIAMLVYLLIGWIVVRLIWLIFETTAPTHV